MTIRSQILLTKISPLIKLSGLISDLTYFYMPRGKNTNVYLSCKECGMQNYKTRINKKTITGKLEHKKYCGKCRQYTLHISGSEIKHSSN